MQFCLDGLLDVAHLLGRGLLAGCGGNFGDGFGNQDAEGSIVDARIVPPTSQNQPAIEADLLDIAKRQGEGTVRYVFPRGTDKTPLDKVAYVRGFAPWNLTIVGAEYMTDIDATFWKMTRTAGVVIVHCVLLLHDTSSAGVDSPWKLKTICVAPGAVLKFTPVTDTTVPPSTGPPEGVMVPDGTGSGAV